jgi:hypothetical protein
MGGLNGYEAVEFTGTRFQSSLPSTLSRTGPEFNFANIPGVVAIANLDLYEFGNVSGAPDESLPYWAVTAPAGSFIMRGDQMAIRLTGVDIGVFVDPITSLNPVKAQANFTFLASTAPIPEPPAALPFSMGFVVAAGRPARRGRFTPAS